MIEKIFSLIAPHYCMLCQKEGYVLCSGCAISTLRKLNARCYKCHKVSVDSKTCVTCRKTSPLSHVWTTVPYEDAAKELLGKLKFQRVKAAAKDAASIVNETLPYFHDIVVVPIPTASKRVRTRGYDQSSLIAKEISKMRNLDFMHLLVRTSSIRQTGSSRETRKIQIQGAFRVKGNANITNMNILLIDDILTTGSTLEEAARILKQHGAKSVSASVVAQKI